jgi:hypothetical protein
MSSSEQPTNGADVTSSSVAPIERRDIVALQVVERTSPTLYANFAGVPVVELPLLGHDAPRRPWPLSSARVREEISCLVYEAKQILLSEQEISRILTFLAGRAWRDERVAVDLLNAFDHDPLIEAAFLFLQSEICAGRFDGPSSELLSGLNTIAATNGILTDQTAWPKGTAQLSRRLAELHANGALGHLGIAFERPQTARPRQIKLRLSMRSDDAVDAASVDRRLINSATREDLRSADGNDDRSLYDQILLPHEESIDE